MMPAVMIFLEDLKLFSGAITPEDLGSAVLAIASYIENGDEPSGLSPMAQVCYNFLKAKTDRQKQSYDAKVAAGRRGGSNKAANAGKDVAEESKDVAEESNDVADASRTVAESSKAVANASKDVADASEGVANPTNLNVEPKPKPKLKPITVTRTSRGVQGGDAAAAAPAPTGKRFVPPTHDEAWAYAIEHKLGIDVDRFLDYYGSQGWRVGKNPMKDWRMAMNNWARTEREKDTARAQQNEKLLNAQKVQQRDLSEADMKISGEDELYREILKMRERGGLNETIGVRDTGGAGGQGEAALYQNGPGIHAG